MGSNVIRIKKSNTPGISVKTMGVKSYSFKLGKNSYTKSAYDTYTFLRNYYNSLYTKITGLYGWNLTLIQNEDSTFGILELTGYIRGAYLPPISSWDPVFRLMPKIGNMLAAGDFDSAIRLLNVVSTQANALYQQLCSYDNDTQPGYTLAIDVLQTVQNSAKTGVNLTVTAMTGNPAWGAAAEGGYAYGLDALQQGLEVAYGTRDKVDFTGITEDALIEALLSYASDMTLGKTVDGYDDMPPTVKVEAAKVFLGFLSNEANGLATTIIQAVVAKYVHSDSSVTWNTLITRIADQFSLQNTIINAANAAIDTANGAAVNSIK